MKPVGEISDLPDVMAIPSAVGGAHPSQDETADSRPLLGTHLNDLYELTKPRMNFLVVITTMVGFYMAARGTAEWRTLLPTLLGTALTAASAAVLNQVIEREHDKLMPRTHNRPMPTGRISVSEAMVYGISLGIAGLTLLVTLVNPLTAIIGAFTLLSYIFVYTPLKRLTTLNTVIGALPGALPPVMGWTAVTGKISPEAIALFSILFFWQMPHFLAIAIMYRRDYEAGGFKMLPVVDPDLVMTSRQIVLYSVALIPISFGPALVKMSGSFYFATALVLGLVFLAFGINCARTRTRGDARKLFFVSIIYLPVLLVALMTNKL